MESTSDDEQLYEAEIKSTRTKRGDGPEAKRVKQRLAGFDPVNCEAIKVLHAKFGKNATHTELKSVAQIICENSNLKLDRDASRDSRVLIKWYDDNIEVIKPILENIDLRDDKDQAITPETYK